MKTFEIDYVTWKPGWKYARSIRKTVKARNDDSAESKGRRLCPKGYTLWAINEVVD